MTRLLIAIAALGLGLAAPAAASAAGDGTSNTIMFAELHHKPILTGFMDYTDDV
jgi:hypothetical protein